MNKLISQIILEKLYSERFISVVDGQLICEYTLLKDLSTFEFEEIKVKILEFNEKNDTNTIIELKHFLKSLDKYIYSKVFINLDTNHKLITDYKLLSCDNNNNKFMDILNFCDKNQYKIVLTYSFIECNKLKVILDKTHLLFYLNKFVNEYVYELTKSNNEETYFNLLNSNPLICINNKYILDGGYRLFNKYLQNPFSKIFVINILNPENPNDLIDYTRELLKKSMYYEYNIKDENISSSILDTNSDNKLMINLQNFIKTIMIE